MVLMRFLSKAGIEGGYQAYQQGLGRGDKRADVCLELELDMLQRC